MTVYEWMFESPWFVFFVAVFTTIGIAAWWMERVDRIRAAQDRRIEERRANRRNP